MQAFDGQAAAENWLAPDRHHGNPRFGGEAGGICGTDKQGVRCWPGRHVPNPVVSRSMTPAQIKEQKWPKHATIYMQLHI